MFYSEVFKALNKNKVEYVVVGGVAVVLYGYQRFTNDLDIIVHLEGENLARLFEAMTSVKYIPKVPVTKEQFVDPGQRKKWVKEKGMIVFSFVKSKPPFNLVDMFIEEPFDYRQIKEKRKKIRVGNINIPLLAIEDLIKLKQKAGRVKDLDDVVQLQEIQRIAKKK